MGREDRAPNRELRHLRELRGWSQKRLADAIDTSKEMVSKWERGEQSASKYYQEKLCKLFEKSAQELGFIHEPERPSSLSHVNDQNLPETNSLQVIYPLLAQAVRQGIIGATQELGDQDLNELRRKILELALGIAIGKIPIERLLPLEAQFRSLRPVSVEELLPQNSARPDQLLQSVDYADISEQELANFEKVTANCWLLLKIDGLSTVNQLLPTYLPKVARFAQQKSRDQERAAHVASQGYMVAGLTAVLNLCPLESEMYCQRAVAYAHIARDYNLKAAALKHLATKFLDNNRPLKTLQKYQEILPFIDEISPLLQSRTYLGLALAFARTKQHQKAIDYLALARDTFPDYPETDPSFVYADCCKSSLNHYEGLIYVEFDQFEKAWETFAQVEDLSKKIAIPQRTRLEIMNCQAEASLSLKDLKSSHDLIEASVKGALELGSEKRYSDALALYKQSRILWPQQQRIKELADLFLR